MRLVTNIFASEDVTHVSGKAGLLAPGSSRFRPLPIPIVIRTVDMAGQSPVTAAGPRRYRTVFPFQAPDFGANLARLTVFSFVTESVAGFLACVNREFAGFLEIPSLPPHQELRGYHDPGFFSISAICLLSTGAS